MVPDFSESPVERVLAAPGTLGRPASDEFRRTALALLEALPPGQGILVIEAAETRDADSTGLAALIAIRRKARERGQTVRLRGVTEPFLGLLRMAKLNGQFEIER
jgi:ABC-type transporter Mla MlaB component